jgi:hypothetical protein
MEITVIRRWFMSECTIGELYIDGERECYTLEDRYREIAGMPTEEWKVPGKTAIPQGRYDLIIDFSQRFQTTMPHILSVPGFTGVRIHCGNNAGDTEGCIILGRIKYENSVGESRLAYNAFMEELKDAIKQGEDVSIIITSPGRADIE